VALCFERSVAIPILRRKSRWTHRRSKPSKRRIHFHKMTPSKELLLERRVTGLWKRDEGKGPYCFHFIGVEGGMLFRFSDEGTLVVHPENDSSLVEAFPEASSAGPPAKDPPVTAYIGQRIARVLVSIVPRKPLQRQRRDRVYVVLENGFYLSSGRELGCTELECDGFERWYSQNKHYEMLRDYWTETPENPFGEFAQRERWFGSRVISPSEEK